VRITRIFVWGSESFKLKSSVFWKSPPFGPRLFAPSLTESLEADDEGVQY